MMKSTRGWSELPHVGEIGSVTQSAWGNSDHPSRNDGGLSPQLTVHFSFIHSLVKLTPLDRPKCPLWDLEVSRRTDRVMVMQSLLQ